MAAQGQAVAVAGLEAREEGNGGLPAAPQGCERVLLICAVTPRPESPGVVLFRLQAMPVGQQGVGKGFPSLHIHLACTQ